MKTFLSSVFLLIAAAVFSAGDATIILSERSVDKCRPAQTIQGALNPASSETLFAAQAFALHARNQNFESADNDIALGKPRMTPNYLYQAAPSALVMLTDSVQNWDLNTVPQRKFVYLFEQNTAGGGQFALLVMGESYSEGLVFDNNTGYSYPQGLQGHSYNNGRGCNASFSDLIGNCGDGSNRPCVTNVVLNTPPGYATITLTWAAPSDQAILYSRDAEDKQSYGFNWVSRQQALKDMIRAWEIYYHDTAAAYVAGDVSGWTLTSDLDGTSVDRGDGQRYSTDSSAQVTLPLSTDGSVVLAVSPVFDGPRSTVLPGDGGMDPARAVLLANVISGASSPIP